jgi:hypothetical protein
MFGTKNEEPAVMPMTEGSQENPVPIVPPSSYVQNVDPLADIPKGFWERLWPVMACGAGLFSDGYINNVSRIYF